MTGTAKLLLLTYSLRREVRFAYKSNKPNLKSFSNQDIICLVNQHNWKTCSFLKIEVNLMVLKFYFSRRFPIGGSLMSCTSFALFESHPNLFLRCVVVFKGSAVVYKIDVTLRLRNRRWIKKRIDFGFVFSFIKIPTVLKVPVFLFWASPKIPHGFY